MYFNHIVQHSALHAYALKKVLAEVVDSGMYLQGKWNLKLEKGVLKYIDTSYGTTVGSGHDALLLALQAAGIGRGSNVVVQANSYPSVFPIVLLGAKPVFVDTTEHGQMNVSQLERVLKKKVDAVILTHMFGETSDVRAIQLLCKRAGVILIEDCAHAFGTTFQKKHVGTFGDFGCFSFYPSKNLGALGDGGFVVTKKKRDIDFIRRLKAYGEKTRYYSEYVAGHSRMPELQAAGLCVYLQHYNEDCVKRKQVLNWYINAVQHYNLVNHVRMLQGHNEAIAVRHLLVIDVKKRNALQKHLAQHNIDALIHYPYPAHKVPAFQRYAPKKSSYPLSEYLAKHTLSLPYHQHMTKKEVEMVVSVIAEFYA